jgi:hypothetical protein
MEYHILMKNKEINIKKYLLRQQEFIQVSQMEVM